MITSKAEINIFKFFSSLSVGSFGATLFKNIFQKNVDFSDGSGMDFPGIERVRVALFLIFGFRAGTGISNFCRAGSGIFPNTRERVRVLGNAIFALKISIFLNYKNLTTPMSVYET